MNPSTNKTTINRVINSLLIVIYIQEDFFLFVYENVFKGWSFFASIVLLVCKL